MVALQAELKAVKESLENIQKKVPSVLLPSSFLPALAREAEFWQKINIHRADKILISATIASEYIGEKETIIVDSGTTVDQIPPILKENKPFVKVYTNNLLAAISVIPPTEKFRCILLSGEIDPIYGATYNIGKIDEPLKAIEANQIILAATAISFEDGPMVQAVDRCNLQFKRAMVQKALQDPGSPRLIIAVGWNKFQKAISEDSNLNPVLDHREWNAVRKDKNFVLVAAKPPESIRTIEAERAREVIKTFIKNMEQGWMKIKICDI